MCVCAGVCAGSGADGGGLCGPCAAGGGAAAAEGGDHGAEQDTPCTRGSWDILIPVVSNTTLVMLFIHWWISMLCSAIFSQCWDCDYIKGWLMQSSMQVSHDHVLFPSPGGAGSWGVWGGAAGRGGAPAEGGGTAGWGTAAYNISMIFIGTVLMDKPLFFQFSTNP